MRFPWIVRLTAVVSTSLYSLDDNCFLQTSTLRLFSLFQLPSRATVSLSVSPNLDEKDLSVSANPF